MSHDTIQLTETMPLLLLLKDLMLNANRSTSNYRHHLKRKRHSYVLYRTLPDNIPTEDTLSQICGLTPAHRGIIEYFCGITTTIGRVIQQKYGVNPIQIMM
jgi:hypothetical protein